jgi:hypothetical protein
MSEGDAAPERKTSKQESRARASWRRGRFLTQWEVSSFLPDGSPHRWWVSFSRPKDRAVQRLIERAGPPGITVEFFGVASEPGTYGHMGLYEREFVVQRIREPEDAAEPKETES